MIDTHSHIYGPEFADDIDDVITRAKAAGVEQILLPNINAASVEPMLRLWKRHPHYLRPMMGLHPEDVREDWQDVLDQLHALLIAPGHPYVAVGEVGLDFYWDTTYRKEQLQAFDTQIRWAIELDLPLAIHCRNAHTEMVELLKAYSKSPNLRGVFHCFGGSSEEAAQLLTFPGFVLGIGGIVTFKKSTLPQVLSEVPLSRIVVETDAPYMAPTPHRGKRNESAYVAEVVNKLATIYRITPKEVSDATNCNVKRTFGGKEGPFLNTF